MGQLTQRCGGRWSDVQVMYGNAVGSFRKKVIGIKIIAGVMIYRIDEVSTEIGILCQLSDVTLIGFEPIQTLCDSPLPAGDCGEPSDALNNFSNEIHLVCRP